MQRYADCQVYPKKAQEGGLIYACLLVICARMPEQSQQKISWHPYISPRTKPQSLRTT